MAITTGKRYSEFDGRIGDLHVSGRNGEALTEQLLAQFGGSLPIPGQEVFPMADFQHTPNICFFVGENAYQQFIQDRACVSRFTIFNELKNGFF